MNKVVFLLLILTALIVSTSPRHETRDQDGVKIVFLKPAHGKV